MSVYSELDRQRKQARPLCLELGALGLDLRAGEALREATGSERACWAKGRQLLWAP